jgi:hypothetical protein
VVLEYVLATVAVQIRLLVAKILFIFSLVNVFIVSVPPNNEEVAHADSEQSIVEAKEIILC